MILARSAFYQSILRFLTSDPNRSDIAGKCISLACIDADVDGIDGFTAMSLYDFRFRWCGKVGISFGSHGNGCSLK